ncbi:MAG: RNA polymerase subunit sigma-24, partial [Elusimicrobia bacterium]|nr:RNA polymerase subunit sigma-24 [Candidatus Obscuribacterium magneticum]
MESTVDSTRKEFQELAFPHMDEMYAAALRMTRNPTDAEDLAAEVFAKAWRFFHQFERGTNMR